MNKTKVEIFEKAIADFGIEAAIEYFQSPLKRIDFAPSIIKETEEPESKIVLSAEEVLESAIRDNYFELRKLPYVFYEGIRKIMESYASQFTTKIADNEKAENDFVEMLVKELPEYGIDTSNWEYDYGDCCYGGAVEFLSRCIKGYAESKPIADNVSEGNKVKNNIDEK